MTPYADTRVTIYYNAPPNSNNLETSRMQVGRFLLKNEKIISKLVAGTGVAAGVVVAANGNTGVAVGTAIAAALLETVGGRARKALHIAAGIGVAGAAAFGGAGFERTAVVLAGTAGTVLSLAATGMAGAVSVGLGRVLGPELMLPVGMVVGITSVVSTGMISNAAASCGIQEVATKVWQLSAGATNIKELAVGIIVATRTNNPIVEMAGPIAIIGGMCAGAGGAILGIKRASRLFVGSAAVALAAATSVAAGAIAGTRIAAVGAGILLGNAVGNSLNSFAKYLIDDPSAQILP